MAQKNGVAATNRRIGLDESIFVKIERYTVFKKTTYGVLRQAQKYVYDKIWRDPLSPKVNIRKAITV